jgi:hypothetical protein
MRRGDVTHWLLLPGGLPAIRHRAEGEHEVGRTKRMSKKMTWSATTIKKPSSPQPRSRSREARELLRLLCACCGTCQGT